MIRANRCSRSARIRNPRLFSSQSSLGDAGAGPDVSQSPRLSSIDRSSQLSFYTEQTSSQFSSNPSTDFSSEAPVDSPTRSNRYPEFNVERSDQNGEDEAKTPSLISNSLSRIEEVQSRRRHPILNKRLVTIEEFQELRMQFTRLESQITKESGAPDEAVSLEQGMQANPSSGNSPRTRRLIQQLRTDMRTELNEKHGACEQEINSIKAEAQNQRTEAAVQKTRADGLESEVATQKTELTAQKERRVELEGRVNGLNNEIEGLTAASHLAEQITDLRYSKFRERIENLESRI